jgi:hypothetical protein
MGAGISAFDGFFWLYAFCTHNSVNYLPFLPILDISRSRDFQSTFGGEPIKNRWRGLTVCISGERAIRDQN